MKFRFNVNVSEHDYLDYNKFWMLRSPYGKKQMLTLRVLVNVVFAVFIFISCFGFAEGFATDILISIILLLILLLLFNVFLNKMFSFSLKGQLVALKKKGKMAYSPSSVIEFFDDSFVETTADNKLEHKYSAIERVSVVDNKMIYIHVNNVMAFMLPIASFESMMQYDSFLEFIKGKCNSIDFYS